MGKVSEQRAEDSLFAGKQSGLHRSLAQHTLELRHKGIKYIYLSDKLQ